MSDGAHQGVSAGRAIATILGGDPPPSEDEQMSPAEFRDWVLGPDQPMDYEAEGHAAYSEAARREARTVLLYFLADPRRASSPGETVYDWDADPDRGMKGMKPEYVKALGVYEAMTAAGITHEEGLSGFQVGWAINAARRCVELGPVANPAIMHIEVTE